MHEILNLPTTCSSNYSSVEDVESAFKSKIPYNSALRFVEFIKVEMATPAGLLMKIPRNRNVLFEMKKNIILIVLKLKVNGIILDDQPDIRKI